MIIFMASERQPTLEEVMSQSNSYMREGLEKAAPKRLAALRERLSRLDPEDPLHQSTVNDIVKLES